MRKILTHNSEKTYKYYITANFISKIEMQTGDINPNTFEVCNFVRNCAKVKACAKLVKLFL